MGARKRKAEAHVRLYRHELECQAWRTLSGDARALLIDVRSYFTGGENRIIYSARMAMECLNTTCHRKARRALGELVERGWIILMEPGGFSRKQRHATVYALGSEPLEEKPGATAPKKYMRWTPEKKSSVAFSTTNGGVKHHRGQVKFPENHADGGVKHHRESTFKEIHGGVKHHTDILPRSTAAEAGAVELLKAAQEVGGPSQSHILLCVVALVWSARANQRRSAA